LLNLHLVIKIFHSNNTILPHILAGSHPSIIGMSGLEVAGVVLGMVSSLQATISQSAEVVMASRKGQIKNRKRTEKFLNEVMDGVKQVSLLLDVLQETGNKFLSSNTLSLATQGVLDDCKKRHGEVMYILGGGASKAIEHINQSKSFLSIRQEREKKEQKRESERLKKELHLFRESVLLLHQLAST
jgi:hypothetical protein